MEGGRKDEGKKGKGKEKERKKIRRKKEGKKEERNDYDSSGGSEVQDQDASQFVSW